MAMKASRVKSSQRTADLLTKTVRVSFSPEDTLTVQVRMTVVPTIIERFQNIQAKFDGFDLDSDDAETAAAVEEAGVELLRELAQMVCDLVKSWDMLDEDDETVELTVDALLALFGPADLITIIAAVVTDYATAASDPKAIRTSKSSSPSKKSAKPRRKS